MTWPALLQKVGYGDVERDRIVDDLIYVVERSGEKNGVGSFNHKVGNRFSEPTPCALATPGEARRIRG